jgi:BirA family biotin operon repressor/biotin-[acetyl-CoA-carboxylase] ligase
MTGSTNDDARRLAAEGAPHGTWVVADAQSQGRGRLGRPWVTEPGDALLMSMVLRPRLAPTDAPLLCLAAAVVIADLHASLRIKWPNDVLLADDRKVAGVLAEADFSSEKPALVIGVGVNLRRAPPLPTAAALVEAGVDLPRHEVASRVAEGLLRWCERLEAGGVGTLIDAWTARSATVDRRVRVGAVEGVALGIDPLGSLWVRTDDGEVVPIRAGDVELVRW